MLVLCDGASRSRISGFSGATLRVCDLAAATLKLGGPARLAVRKRGFHGVRDFRTLPQVGRLSYPVCMERSTFLEPLDNVRLRERVREVIESRRWSLAVTLISGDLLFGDYFALHVPVQDPATEFIHVPSYWDAKTKQLGFGFRLEPFEIIYNTEAGTTHGAANIITLPAGQVAHIAHVSWDVTQSTGFKNISNPYASLVSLHNDSVALNNHLETTGYAEFAMATSHITAEGIHFSKQELLYADYAYFGRLPSTSLSVGGLGVGGGVTRGLETLVISALRGGATGRLHLPTSLGCYEGLVESLPDDVDTEIEGEQWFLALLSLDGNPRTRMPVLFKRSAVAYPREFWPYIKSRLVVIGENRQIPISYQNSAWPECILARLIGYVP
jgi:hypothetical protein